MQAPYDVLYGAYNDGYSSDDVSHNKVVIDGSSLDEVSGGYVEFSPDDPSDAAGCYNEVTITNGSNVGVEGYGAYTYGACTMYGESSHNRVTVENSTVYTTIYAGSSERAEANHNTVSLTNAETSDIYGGTGAAGASGNTVSVAGSTTSSVVGGFATDGYASASDNTVTISDSEVTGSITGGRKHGSGDATGNRITIENSEVAGYSWSGATYTDIIAGSAYEGDATGNFVTLKGEKNSLEYATIYGGRSSYGDDVTGNTLTLDGFKGTVDGIRNFDTVNFVLNSWEEGATLLTLTDEESLLNNFTLNIDFATWNAEVEAEGQMTLIAGLNAESLLANWTFSVGGVSPFSADTPFDVQLVAREDGLMDLVAVAAGNDTVPEPTTATLSLLALAALAARRRRK